MTVPAAPDLSILNVHHLATLVADKGTPMVGADANGLPLHSNGHLGVDLIRVPPGGQFPVHTHPGDHLLYTVTGEGTITVDDVTHTVKPGDIYMIPGDVPHAVGAGPDVGHVLLAVGAPHKAVDDPERMTWTDWYGNRLDAPQVPSSATG